MVKLDWPPPFQDYGDPYIHILGFSSVNGVICLYNRIDYDDTTTVLWNPSTGEFKTIPHNLQPNENIEFNLTPSAFGYDSITDDYKVIHALQYPEDFEGNWVFVRNKASWFWELIGLKNDDDDNFWDRFFNGQEVPMYDPFWEIYSLKSNS
ncbi:F-box/kelch-repeat protein At3g06240-like [Lathyrus oleraceus]|uniref:F-box/kelch-repeat protein At3g06240-like n=1 Tax=Pisum sativum TaxID=3888 RepID=UPI0021D01668|nr:F-box/kelch-repeat protein At3g06240-like [Pisum sativum]